ncbi:MAG: hypothetical protein KJ626_03690 [Verrucomicrobia bacterium]|nr:hypothetical protein [Verrucomicrobiota bacterium]
MMFSRIKQFTRLAGLTAIETIRQPICLLLTVTCILFVAVLPLLLAHQLGEAGKMVRDSAFSLQFIGGLLIGSFAACSSISSEIRSGTAASILSKPVSRSLFFLAKFAGISAVMIALCTAMALACTISTRTASFAYRIDWWAASPLIALCILALFTAALTNYFWNRPFASDAFGFLIAAVIIAFVVSAFVGPDGKLTSFAAHYNLALFPVSLLITMAVLVLTAVAVSLATRLHIVPTLSLCSALLLVGLISDYLFGRHAADHAVAAFLYGIIPNWQHFWVVDALNGGGSVPWIYIGWAGLYALVYLTGVLALGIATFRVMDVRA